MDRALPQDRDLPDCAPPAAFLLINHGVLRHQLQRQCSPTRGSDELHRREDCLGAPEADEEEGAHDPI